MGFGDGLRQVAHAIEPDPRRVMVSLTPDGTSYAEQLRGKGTLGAILTHLSQYAPQTISQISSSIDVPQGIVRRQIETFPQYFVKRG